MSHAHRRPPGYFPVKFSRGELITQPVQIIDGKAAPLAISRLQQIDMPGDGQCMFYCVGAGLADHICKGRYDLTNVTTHKDQPNPRNLSGDFVTAIKNNTLRMKMSEQFKSWIDSRGFDAGYSYTRFAINEFTVLNSELDSLPPEQFIQSLQTKIRALNNNRDPREIQAKLTAYIYFLGLGLRGLRTAFAEPRPRLQNPMPPSAQSPFLADRNRQLRNAPTAGEGTANDLFPLGEFLGVATSNIFRGKDEKGVAHNVFFAKRDFYCNSQGFLTQDAVDVMVLHREDRSHYEYLHPVDRGDSLWDLVPGKKISPLAPIAPRNNQPQTPSHVPIQVPVEGMLGKKIPPENADIDEWPGDKYAAEKFGKGTLASQQLTIGDLHGNALKLMYLLVRHSVMNISKENYDRFVELYRKPVDELTKGDITEIINLINALTPTGAYPLIRLIGDELADRGSNDFFTLLLFEKMSKSHIPFEVLVSNHGIDFLQASEDPETAFKPPRLQRNHAGSMYGLKTLVDKNLVTKETVLQLSRAHYKPNVKALSYTLSHDKQKITLYSHAAIDISVIESMANKLRVPFDDASAFALAHTIDQINTVFGRHVAANTLHTLYDEAVMMQGYRGEVIDHRLHPFEFLMWNRSYEPGLGDDSDPSKITISRPPLHKGYAVEYSHGHDSTDPGKAHIFNLDNALGKALYYHEKPYNVLHRSGTTTGYTHALANVKPPIKDEKLARRVPVTQSNSAKNKAVSSPVNQGGRPASVGGSAASGKEENKAKPATNAEKNSASASETNNLKSSLSAEETPKNRSNERTPSFLSKEVTSAFEDEGWKVSENKPTVKKFVKDGEEITARVSSLETFSRASTTFDAMLIGYLRIYPATPIKDRVLPKIETEDKTLVGPWIKALEKAYPDLNKEQVKKLVKVPEVLENEPPARPALRRGIS